MKLIKNGLLCFIASSVFGILWLILLNVFNSLGYMNNELITVSVFIAASVCIALISTRKYLKQDDRSIYKKIGCVALMTVLAFAIMVCAFYIAIFVLLYYHG